MKCTGRIFLSFLRITNPVHGNECCDFEVHDSEIDTLFIGPWHELGRRANRKGFPPSGKPRCVRRSWISDERRFDCGFLDLIVAGHCGIPLGYLRPSSDGGKTLVLIPKASRGVEQMDDKSWMIHCRHCGHVTEWTGEIKWPKAA